MKRQLLDLTKIQIAQRKFSRARDWDQFHHPKNLSMALSCEAAELAEIFQWLSEAESQEVKVDRKKKEAVSHEMADILYYLVRLADKMDINLESAFWKKFRLNQKKYPVRLAKGNAKKYYELRESK